MSERHVVIVGGGITGLAAAYGAVVRAREQNRPVAVTVLERTPRFGGNLVTERIEGCLVDGGPDSWVASKPDATGMARDLGLAEDIVGTNPATRRYYIAWGEGLHPVPEGLVLGVPTRILPLARSNLFSWWGKARMAIEPLVPVRTLDGDDDESIGDFAARRLGREAAERLVAPLLGGITSGDASNVSMRATFPQLVAMEREHGSLVLGMAAQARGRKRTDGASAFLSLRGGVGSLVDALANRLRAEGVVLRAGVAVRSLARKGTEWRIDLESEESITARSVLLAVPAHVTARLVLALDGVLARELASIPYGSSATVFLAYRRADVAHPLDGVGFVVPRTLGRSIRAGTWVSSKWQGRAPAGHVLMRAFFGGAGGEADLALGDAALAELGRRELESLMGFDAEPLWSKVFRFDGSRAQMRVGHLARVRGIRERLVTAVPGLRIAFGGFDGDSIPDGIRQGREAGRAMVEEGL